MIDDTGNSYDLTLILVSLNLGVLLHEDGVLVSDADTCRSDIRFYLYTSKVHFCGMNEHFDPINMQGKNNIK
jgi:hypothetical protein